MSPPRRKDRLQAYRRGTLSEYVAALYLLLKGYRILDMRFRSRSGEIDIVARRRDVVAFIEVKARRGIDEAVLAVDPATQRRIRNASLDWISRKGRSGSFSWRYDIIAVTPWRLPRHFSDAF